MLKTEAFYLEFLIAVLEDSREECERGNTPSKPGNVPKREGVLLVCSDLGGWDNAHPICVKPESVKFDFLQTTKRPVATAI